MNRCFLLVLVSVLMFSSPLLAQANNDSIQIKSSFFGTTYKQNGIKLGHDQVLLMLENNNQSAYNALKVASKKNSYAQFLSVMGGIMIGIPIGTAIVGKEEPNWILAAIGSGFVIGSVPLSMSYSKQAQRAISIYNASLNQTTRLNLSFGTTRHGYGLIFSF